MRKKLRLQTDFSQPSIFSNEELDDLAEETFFRNFGKDKSDEVKLKELQEAYEKQKQILESRKSEIQRLTMKLHELEKKQLDLCLQMSKKISTCELRNSIIKSLSLFETKKEAIDFIHKLRDILQNEEWNYIHDSLIGEVSAKFDDKWTMLPAKNALVTMNIAGPGGIIEIANQNTTDNQK